MFEDIFEKSEKLLKREEKNKPHIIVDIHEKNSLVVSELVSLGADIEFKSLEVGDYIAQDVIIERKTASDFLSSMISKRLQNQLIGLKQHEKSILIIENFDERYDTNINTNAIRGFIMSVLLNFKVPIIFTEDYQDTAHYLYILGKHKENQEISLRAKRHSLNKKQQLQFILEGFPGIGPSKAKKLIEKFKTIKNIINASEQDLQEILGKKTKDFVDLIHG